MLANFVELKDAYFASLDADSIVEQDSSPGLKEPIFRGREVGRARLPFEPGPQRSPVLEALVYRPSVFKRNEVRWISVFNWRAQRKAQGLLALKRAKESLDRQVISEAAVSIAALSCELFGDHPADVVTSVPCGHSQRPDCFSNQLARAVAANLQIGFLQLFAERPTRGVSHPKSCVRLNPLKQIGRPPRSVLLVDDLATSGFHIEEATMALRSLGSSGPAIAWISGVKKGAGAGAVGSPGNASPEMDDARDRDIQLY